ncbi:hypothetical protein [Hasllibacter sp. MH4015]|uniref:hypothetical protein n=1 Tax=Hasllibacter sp. MH4015 TaxID=2854029 RepID=UPI001CD30B2D|nr:hypothetical protein [Hasllibacter sp. MH4015]
MARKKKIDPNEVLASITPKPARRVVAVGMIVALGLIVLSVAIARPPAALGWMLFLTFFGAGCMWLAWAMWQATGRRIELTRSELREVGEDGRVLCTIENLAKVDRGMFAYKPAGGFVVRLKEPMSRVYAPGMWSRFGRTLSVGGASGRRDCKEVADLMIVLMVERDGGLS